MKHKNKMEGEIDSIKVNLTQETNEENKSIFLDCWL